MTTEASLALIGGTPPPDARRVEAIRAAIDLSDAEIAATFGERARLDVLNLIERLLAETRTGDLGECSGLLDHLRERLGTLDPRRLDPPGGIAGWFGGRGGRLKRFREEFLSAVRGLSETAGDIVDRGGGIDRRCAALETLWSEARTVISELDAYIAAGAARLAEPAPVITPVAAAVMEDVSTPQAASKELADTVVHHPAEPLPEPEPGPAMEAPKPVMDAEAATDPGPAGPHPLAARLEALVSVRNAALRQLPLVRQAQNADCRVPDRLKSVGDAVTAWREEWGDALGLNGKRSRKIKPDQVWLTRERERLTGLIDAADQDIAAARARRAEAETRMAGVAETVRRAA